jgi:hypothetical protein
MHATAIPPQTMCATSARKSWTHGSSEQSGMWTRSLLWHSLASGLQRCYHIEQQQFHPLVAPPACGTEHCQPSASTTSLSPMMMFAMDNAATKSGLLNATGGIVPSVVHGDTLFTLARTFVQTLIVYTALHSIVRACLLVV